MAYVQKNNPFAVTGCGRRRSYMTTNNPAPFKRCWDGYKPNPDGRPAEDSGSCVPDGGPKMMENGSPFERTKPYTAGMSAAERKTYNNKTGGNVKGPQPEGGSRKDAYCARSAGIKKCQDPDKNGDCPNDIARRNWKC